MTLHRSTCIPAPEFSHRETKEPVPPQGTLERLLLRTEQTGWSVVYNRNRIGKDRTGPDLDDRPLSIYQYVTEPGDPSGHLKLFLHKRRRSPVDRSLVAGRAQRQWHQACLPD